ncbi:hypothetical protein DAPPUDRAFT_279076 [Daphnia pulex]|uniref:Uncharacterized protein n=1 Tax=Daphnia pulex TaxID=6669 RepID=E9I771_DAPPU|nr:hypothetical protein DAPPUDRAFT_279076 [Daphnia pulex]|eukprot:EFX60160.1 hypothetical protein DAPPUDRAFT_279076 [Daphnia pulex]
MKAPVHTEAVICADPAAWATQARVAGQAAAASTTPPGTISTSGAAALAKSASGNTRRPARARTGAMLRATHCTTNGAAASGCCRWCMRLAVVNTS